METAELAKQFRKIQKNLGIINSDLLKRMSDDDLIYIYRDCTNCNEPKTTKKKIKELIRTATSDDDLLEMMNKIICPICGLGVKPSTPENIEKAINSVSF